MSELRQPSARALRAMFPEIEAAGEVMELMTGFKRLGLLPEVYDTGNAAEISLQLLNGFQLTLRPYGDAYGDVTLWTATTHEVRQRIKGRNPMEAMLNAFAGETAFHAQKVLTFRVTVSLEASGVAESTSFLSVIEAANPIEVAEHALAWARHTSALPLAYARRPRRRSAQ